MHKKGTNCKTYLRRGKLSLWGKKSNHNNRDNLPNLQQKKLTTLSKPSTTPGPKLDTETRVLRKEKTFEKSSTHQLV